MVCPAVYKTHTYLARAHHSQKWHTLVTADQRDHLVAKLVKAIAPSPQDIDCESSQLCNLVVWVPNAEQEMFQVANDRNEYYNLLAEKIYKIQKEINENKIERVLSRQDNTENVGQELASGRQHRSGNVYNVRDDVMAPPHSIQTVQIATEKKTAISDDDTARSLSIQRCINSLVHACSCRDVNCIDGSCHRMKRVIQHTRQCRRRQNAQCPVCKQLIALCCYHARTCVDAQCQLPFCANIRQRLHEQSTKHRPDRMEVDWLMFVLWVIGYDCNFFLWLYCFIAQPIPELFFLCFTALFLCVRVKINWFFISLPFKVTSRTLFACDLLP
jgi:hypothetical protein